MRGTPVFHPDLLQWTAARHDTLLSRVQGRLPLSPNLCSQNFRSDCATAGGAAISHDINYKNVGRAVQTVLGREGIRGLYRGVDAMALGAGPAHAFYFATYEVRFPSRAAMSSIAGLLICSSGSRSQH